MQPTRCLCILLCPKNVNLVVVSTDRTLRHVFPLRRCCISFLCNCTHSHLYLFLPERRLLSVDKALTTLLPLLAAPLLRRLSPLTDDDATVDPVDSRCCFKASFGNGSFALSLHSAALLSSSAPLFLENHDPLLPLLPVDVLEALSSGALQALRGCIAVLFNPNPIVFLACSSF